MKEFVGVAETEVSSVTSLYSVAVSIHLKSVRYYVAYQPIFLNGNNGVHFWQGRNADALALYFGEDPARCPFEQGKKIRFSSWVIFDVVDC